MKNWYDYIEQFHPPKDEPEAEPKSPLSRWEKNVLEPQATLDLHGLDRVSALQRLDQFLQLARRRGLIKILVIHGKGLHSSAEQVLKTQVFQWASMQKGIKLRKAPLKWGGGGASLVYLA